MTEIQFELVRDTSVDVYAGPVLYKLDSVGRLRTWQMELTALGHYRTLAGLDGGKQAESGWTIPTVASKATVKEQGEFEVRSMYKHQLDREYHATRDTVSQPKIIEPMLAKAYAGFPGIGYTQPKLDGIRCLADVNGLWTRQGQPIIAVPHVHAMLKPIFEQYPDAVFDGELYNHDLREDFGAISSVVRKKNPTADQLAHAEKFMQYHVYDMVDANSKFSERYQFLKAVLAPIQGFIVIVPTRLCLSAAEADDAYGEFVSLGYEGGMYRLDTVYELGRRSKSLLKRKEFITKEFKLTGLFEGVGNWAGAIKRAELETEDGQPFGAGIRGSYEEGVALLQTVLSPAAVATVRYFMLSPDGIPRFPVVIDIHPDGRKD